MQTKKNHIYDDLRNKYPYTTKTQAQSQSGRRNEMLITKIQTNKKKRKKNTNIQSNNKNKQTKKRTQKTKQETKQKKKRPTQQKQPRK